MLTGNEYTRHNGSANLAKNELPALFVRPEKTAPAALMLVWPRDVWVVAAELHALKSRDAKPCSPRIFQPLCSL